MLVKVFNSKYALGMSNSSLVYPVLDLSASTFDASKSIAAERRYVVTLADLGLDLIWPKFIRVPERGLSFARPTRVPLFSTDFEPVIYTSGSLSLHVIPKGASL
jgi:hypothetical protein